MITREEVYDLVKDLKSHTLSALRENQKCLLPYIYTDEDMVVDADGKWHSEKTKIHAVDSYHYKDRWYMYKYSDDNPSETFGILKVANLPYRTFDNKAEKQSFIGGLEKLMEQDYIVPFMLFLDDKFVNWNDIEIVFDCNESYLLLHGDKYNWHNLRKVKKFTIVVIPYKVEYIGIESDD